VQVGNAGGGVGDLPGEPPRILHRCGHVHQVAGKPGHRRGGAGDRDRVGVHRRVLHQQVDRRQGGCVPVRAEPEPVRRQQQSFYQPSGNGGGSTGG